MWLRAASAGTHPRRLSQGKQIFPLLQNPPLTCPLRPAHRAALLQIGCSIKHVSQADGTDLDPANTKYRPRGEGAGGPQVRRACGILVQDQVVAPAHISSELVNLSRPPHAAAHSACPHALPADARAETPPPHWPLLQGQQPIGAQAGVAHDGAIDWGHLKADVVQVCFVSPAAVLFSRLQRALPLASCHSRHAQHAAAASQPHENPALPKLPWPRLPCRGVCSTVRVRNTTSWQTLGMRPAHPGAARRRGHPQAWAAAPTRRPCHPGACCAPHVMAALCFAAALLQGCGVVSEQSVGNTAKRNSTKAVQKMQHFAAYK